MVEYKLVDQYGLLPFLVHASHVMLTKILGVFQCSNGANVCFLVQTQNIYFNSVVFRYFILKYIKKNSRLQSSNFLECIFLVE